MKNILIKSTHTLFALLLFVFAYLQINDPDPIIWVSFYVICAAVPLLLLFNIYDRRIFWVAAGLCLLHLGIAAPGIYDYVAHHLNQSIIQDMSPERPYIEESREFLGTVIALVLMAISVLLARKKFF